MTKKKKEQDLEKETQTVSSKTWEKVKAGEKISSFEQNELYLQVEKHHADSDNFISPSRSEWDTKEELLLGVVNDDLSGTTKSQVFDPQLATQVFERASRVMFNNPRGKSVAISKGDIGKNLLMDLIINYCYKNANDFQSMLIKYRMMDYMSLVYGASFGIVPWVIDVNSNYIGPELHIQRIRDCFPQPGKDSIESSDWFGIYKLTQLSAIEKLSGLYNFDELKTEVKDSGGDQRGSERLSKIETERHSTDIPTDKVFPEVDVYTEYRSDVWITVSFKYKKIVRIIANPYNNGKLPIVTKTAFPLQDTMIGLGEFERGQRLQKAINSLHNLYLDSVKYGLFPPLKIKSSGVRRSTMKWGFGERWEMDDVNNVKPLEISPIGLNMYQSTYGVLSSALANQSGTTNVSIPDGVSRNLGETATGVKFVSQRQSARDNWDQILMEDTIKQVTCRWQELIVNKMERPFTLKVFKDDVEHIARRYPDVLQVFDDEHRVSIDKEMIKPEKKDEGIYYDYDVEIGSTIKPEVENDMQNLNMLLSIVTKSPQVVQMLAQKGKEIDVAELLMRISEKGGIKDPDKIIKDIDQQQMQQQVMGQQQMQMPKFNDQFIQQQALEAMNAMGGVNGIPSGNPGQSY